jgi:hypothetical protein
MSLKIDFEVYIYDLDRRNASCKGGKRSRGERRDSKKPAVRLSDLVSPERCAVSLYSLGM